jgi:hypothetical protein
MTQVTTSADIVEWAMSPAGADPLDLDRLDPATAQGFARALVQPRRMEVVERIEALAKSLWLDVLTPGGVCGGQEAVSCGSFFSAVGFFHKYKPYGVKIASPFGYSIFDLHEGVGFSFQVHLEPKVEAFFILDAKRRSLVYLSSIAEWEEKGFQWAQKAMSGRDTPDPSGVLRPVPGDVIVIAETEVVHSVLGCVLEEYATCSVDAVERLFDQNSRDIVTLPSAHGSVADLLTASAGVAPQRFLHREVDGWAVEVADDPQLIVDLGRDLWGGRFRVGGGEDFAIAPDDDSIVLLIAIDGPLAVRIGNDRTIVPSGRFSCVPAGLSASVESIGSATCVSVHRVSRKHAVAEWTR